MSSVFVGENKIPRDFNRYCSQFSLLEIDCERGRVPGKARLIACAEKAPEGFVFCLVVPSILSNLEEHPESEQEWERITKISKLVKATYWVVRTPAAVRPTRRSRVKLKELFERLRGLGPQVAWEAGGVWDESDAVSTAIELGATPVQDVARAMPLAADALYCRVLALGRGSRVGMGLAERIAERATIFPTALIVVEGSGAATVVKVIKEYADASEDDSQGDWEDLIDEEEDEEEPDGGTESTGDDS